MTIVNLSHLAKSMIEASCRNIKAAAGQLTATKTFSMQAHYIPGHTHPDGVTAQKYFDLARDRFDAWLKHITHLLDTAHVEWDFDCINPDREDCWRPLTGTGSDHESRQARVKITAPAEVWAHIGIENFALHLTEGSQPVTFNYFNYVAELDELKPKITSRLFPDGFIDYT